MTKPAESIHSPTRGVIKLLCVDYFVWDKALGRAGKRMPSAAQRATTASSRHPPGQVSLSYLDVLLRQLILHRHLVPVGALSTTVALALHKEGADAGLVALQAQTHKQGSQARHQHASAAKMALTP